MKKVTVLLILSLAICLAACGKKVSTPDEMLDVVKEKENISAEVDMIECGRIVDNDTTIVVGMTGENDKTYHYYAAQFSKNQDGKYKYKNAISLNDIGWQLRLGIDPCLRTGSWGDASLSGFLLSQESDFYGPHPKFRQ